jgi:hypothetical protein
MDNGRCKPIPQSDKACKIGGGEVNRQDNCSEYGAEFLDSTNDNCACVSAENQAQVYDEATEREIAEAIFDWWISKKSYKEWYAEKYLQQKIDFNEDENKTNT